MSPGTAHAWRRGTLVLLLLAGLCANARAQTAQPATDDVRAYRLGQAYERSFEDFLMPGICGIVLERDRCRDDFATVRAFGPRRNDDAIAAWLVDGDRDTRLKDWDGMQVSDRTWQSAPSFAWWYTV